MSMPVTGLKTFIPKSTNKSEKQDSKNNGTAQAIEDSTWGFKSEEVTLPSNTNHTKEDSSWGFKPEDKNSTAGQSRESARVEQKTIKAKLDVNVEKVAKAFLAAKTQLQQNSDNLIHLDNDSVIKFIKNVKEYAVKFEDSGYKKFAQNKIFSL